MSEFVLGKNVTGHWTSFTDLAKDFGCKPVTMKSNNKSKLESQQKKFANRHICKACGRPMTYLNGSNIMVCQNPQCLGIKVEKTDSTGNTTVTYLTSYDLLDEKGAEIANKIYGIKKENKK